MGSAPELFNLRSTPSWFRPPKVFRDNIPEKIMMAVVVFLAMVGGCAISIVSNPELTANAQDSIWVVGVVAAIAVTVFFTGIGVPARFQPLRHLLLNWLGALAIAGFVFLLVGALVYRAWQSSIGRIVVMACGGLVAIAFVLYFLALVLNAVPERIWRIRGLGRGVLIGVGGSYLAVQVLHLSLFQFWIAAIVLFALWSLLADDLAARAVSAQKNKLIGN